MFLRRHKRFRSQIASWPTRSNDSFEAKDDEKEEVNLNGNKGGTKADDEASKQREASPRVNTIKDITMSIVSQQRMEIQVSKARLSDE
ncbi:hypothetical protein J1N35_014112 [Gossypium stocksii]|uniref:Uncharacterized protein n=1 Tax=Gossypium stocksii TaxID=47602 RepID=A0A9D4A9E8_9ROSI|nr:hypothetical protein J1N35_014112 [Gossypium stocksii]